MDEVSVCVIEGEAFIIVSSEGEAVGMCSLVDAIAEGVEHSHGVERVGWMRLATDLEMLARLLRLSLAQHGIDCKSREREDEGQGSGH